MNIEDFLSPEHTQSHVLGVSKKRTLEYLSTFLGDENEGDSDLIYQKLLERERLGSTGIGEGVAVPHCRVKGCKKITGALLKLTEGIDFDAIDSRPVDLVFALIVPDEQNQQHLEALSIIARLMQDPVVRDNLRDASSDRDLYDLATAQTSQDQ